EFLALSDENEEVVAAFLKRKPIHSWVAVEGIESAISEAYGIDGIPTTIIVNQKGLIAAITHPGELEPKHIEEVLATGKSSLPLSRTDREAESDEKKEPPPTRKPLFEISVRRSAARPEGMGWDYWPRADHTNGDFRGEYATVRSALLTLFEVKE